jgi:hypothetical protein
MMAILATLAAATAGLARPAFAIVPQIWNVVPYPVDGSTYLNVTVYHTPEISTHYVNVIMVTMDTNSASLIIGVQNLNPDDTFFVQYDLGPISGTPTAHVEAHCIINGWSDEWIGPVPEYSAPALILTMMFAVSATVLSFQRIKRRIHK